MKLTEFVKKYESQLGVSIVTFRKYVKSGQLEGVKIFKNAKQSTYIVTDEEKLISSWLRK